MIWLSMVYLDKTVTVYLFGQMLFPYHQWRYSNQIILASLHNTNLYP